MDKSKPLTLSWEFGVAARCVRKGQLNRHKVPTSHAVCQQSHRHVTRIPYYHGGFRAVERGRLIRALCLISSSD